MDFAIFNQTSTYDISQAKQNPDCHCSKPVKEGMYALKHSFTIKNWKIFCIIILISKLNEQFKNFTIIASNTTNDWRKFVEKVIGSTASDFTFLLC